LLRKGVGHPLRQLGNKNREIGWATRRSDGTLLWVDDSHEPLSVGTTSGITQDYVFLDGKRIAFVPLSSGHAYYYLSDHLGSDTVVAGGDGKSIQWEADYFPFGARRTVITNLVSNPYQFTGYEYDSGSGYNYAVARYEAGRWGRFQSPDPYLGSASVSNPQSLNRYSYVNNNPANLIDPLGLIALCPPGTQTDSKGTGCEPKSHAPLLSGQSGGGGGTPTPAPGGPPDPKTPPKTPKPPPKKPDHSCRDAVIETTVGGVLILGDIALAWVVLPEVFAYEGEDLIDAISHGATSTLIAGVPGAVLYTDGIGNMTSHCN
jgi:RHS repeat-associated protein